MKRLSLTLALLASLVLAVGCPKKKGDDNGATPTPSPSPAATGMAMGTLTLPSPTSTPAATPDVTPEAKDVTAIKYRWGGGLSPIHHYELNVRGDKLAFAVKSMRSEEKTLEETLSREEVAALAKLIDDVKFFDATESPRKVRIMDIGEASITVWKDGKTHTVRESGTTQMSPELKPLKKWLDDKSRLYLQKTGALPGPKMTETPAK